MLSLRSKGNSTWYRWEAAGDGLLGSRLFPRPALRCMPDQRKWPFSIADLRIDPQSMESERKISLKTYINGVRSASQLRWQSNSPSSDIPNEVDSKDQPRQRVCDRGIPIHVNVHSESFCECTLSVCESRFLSPHIEPNKLFSLNNWMDIHMKNHKLPYSVFAKRDVWMLSEMLSECRESWARSLCPCDPVKARHLGCWACWADHRSSSQGSIQCTVLPR